MSLKYRGAKRVKIKTKTHPLIRPLLSSDGLHMGADENFDVYLPSPLCILLNKFLVC